MWMVAYTPGQTRSNWAIFAAPINREGLSAIIGVEFDFASDKMVAGICASFSSGPSILAECDLFAPGRRQKMTIMDRSEVRR